MGKRVGKEIGCLDTPTLQLDLSPRGASCEDRLVARIAYYVPPASVYTRHMCTHGYLSR